MVSLLQTAEMRSPQAAIVNNFVSGWLLYLKQTNMATNSEVSKVHVENESNWMWILDVDVSPTEAVFLIASNIVGGMMKTCIYD